MRTMFGDTLVEGSHGAYYVQLHTGGGVAMCHSPTVSPFPVIDCGMEFSAYTTSFVLFFSGLFASSMILQTEALLAVKQVLCESSQACPSATLWHP